VLFFSFALSVHAPEGRFRVLDPAALADFLAEKKVASAPSVITNFNYYDMADRALFARGIEICICDDGKLQIGWDPQKILGIALDGIISSEVFSSGKQSFARRFKKAGEKERFKYLNMCLPLLISSDAEYSIPDYLVSNGLEYFAMVRIHRKTYDLGRFLLMDDEIEGVGRFISVELKEPDSDDSCDDDVVVDGSDLADFLSPLVRDRRFSGCAIQKTEQTYLQIVVEAADRHARK